MKIYRERSGTIFIKGQHSCILEVGERINVIFIKVIVWKLRLNHECFTTDGATWLSAPMGGRKAHYNPEKPQEYHICVDIQKSFDRLDRIRIVNLNFFNRQFSSMK